MQDRQFLSSCAGFCTKPLRFVQRMNEVLSVFHDTSSAVSHYYLSLFIELKEP